MVVCPNKSLPSWKSLSEKLGEDRAMFAFVRNGNEIPESVERARELITNRGVLESLEKLPVLSEESVFDMLKNGSLIIGDQITLKDKKYYKLNLDEDRIGAKLGDITQTYGTILEYNDDYVSVNQEFVDSWNRLSIMLSPSRKSLTELSKSFLSRIGVDIKQQDDVIEKYGSNGIADFAERVVRIQSGKEDEALPEEALHFFIDMMDQSNPALLEALDKIRTTDTYKTTLEQYKDKPNYQINGKPNFSKIRKEALAKHLAESMMKKEKAGLKEWIKNIIDSIINYIKQVKVQKSPFEILEDEFYAQRIEDLNLNLDSDEIYNQLTDDQKAFYDVQINKKNVTVEQKEAVKKILSLTAGVFFHSESHTLVRTDTLAGEDVEVKNADGTIETVKGVRLKSVTTVLGSDFFSKLESLDIIQSAIEFFEPEAVALAGIDPTLDEETKGKKIIEYLIDQLVKEDFTEETVDTNQKLEDLLKSIFGEKVTKYFLEAKENKQKTLFGTAIHSIAESIALDKPLDLDNMDLIVNKYMTKDQLRGIVFGTLYNPGIQKILTDLVDSGHILMTEIAAGSGEIGGIIDIIAVDEKGFSRLFDFKTKFIRKFDTSKKDIIDEFNAQINVLGPTPVKEDSKTIPALIGTRRSRKTKYAQQQSLYKAILMDNGIPVKDINIIGIPYRINEETKKISEIKTAIVPLTYNISFADYLFPNLDPTLDKEKVEKFESRQDERMKFVQDIENAKLKDKFIEMFAKLEQIFTYYNKSKDASKIYELFDDRATKTNRLKLQYETIKNALDNWDEVRDFLNVQSQFLEFIDSIGEMLPVVYDYYNRIVSTVSVTDTAKAEKLNEMHKIKNLLLGYRDMLRDISPEEADLDNLLSKSINTLKGSIDVLLDNYNRRIEKDLADILGSEFFEGVFDTLKREYDEMIKSAEARGDKKRVEALKKERDSYTDRNLILDTLKGAKGDVNAFYSYLMATVSNPDVVIAGFARRLKSTLDQVRLENKDLRDRVGLEFDKRAKVYGRGLDVKSINKSLVYVVTEFDPQTGEEQKSLHFKTMFDESLYYDYNKLRYAYNQAKETEDEKEIKKAKKKLRDFERKYLQTQFTEEYYRLTKPLDQTVMYQNEETTVREIRANLYERINRIQDLYRKENLATMEDISPDHYEELIDLKKQLAQLKEKYDINGNLKAGDALKIALALEEYDKNREKLYDINEDQTSFNVLDEKMKLLYGEDSEEYKKWYANNTRLVISEEYYKTREALLTEKGQILEQISDSQEIKDLYRELSVLSAPYKDKDGFINGSRVPEDVAKKIKDIQEKIDFLTSDSTFSPVSGYTREEHNEIQILKFHKDNDIAYIDPDTGFEIDVKRRLRDLKILKNERIESMKLTDPQFAIKMDRLKEINQELAQMSAYTTTNYYFEELKKQEEMFAESINVTYAELKASNDLYKKFKESDWYILNHKITQRVVYEDPLTGDTKEVTSALPNYQWRRNMPDEKYIQVKPGTHFTRYTLKESYVNDKGESVQLLREDNRDVQGRLKPKTNEEYKKEYGKDHPYLNKEYVDLKNKVESKTANQREKVDYENLLSIEDEMLRAQEGLPFSQAIGMAVPFREKTSRERIVESGGKSLLDKPKSLLRGLRRGIGRTEQDLEQEGIGGSRKGVSALATVDNNEVRFVPVRFSGKGDIKDTSYDVWGGVLDYLSSVNRKKALDRELAIANGLEEVLQDPKNQPKSEKENKIVNRIYKKYVTDNIKKVLFVNKGTNVRKEILTSFINSVFYQEEYFGGFNVLGVNSHKGINLVAQSVNLAVLAFAPANWATNYLSGNVQNMVNSVGGRHFTMKGFAESKKIIYSDSIFGGKYGNIMKDMMRDVGKVGNLSFWGQIFEVYDPVQGDFENEFGEKTRFNAFTNILSAGMYVGKMWGEWEIQMSAFIAFMRNHKLYKDPTTDKYKVYKREDFITMKVGDVSEMTIDEISKKKLEAIKEFEALENDLLTIMELDKNKKLSIKSEFKDAYDFGSKDFSRVVAELHGVQKRINGSYAKFDKAYAEKTTVGRLLYFYRKYLVPIGVRRWGTRRVDWETESLEEGFYLTFLRTMGRDLISFRLKSLLKWNRLSDFEKRAVKATMTDLLVVNAINMIVLPLLLGFDDDDDKKYKKLKKSNWAIQQLILVTKKLKSETEQFIPSNGYSEVKRIYNNGSLIISQLFNIGDIIGLSIGHTKEVISGTKNEDLYYKKSVGKNPLKKRKTAKIISKIARLFGYTGKNWYPEDAIQAFDNYDNDLFGD